MSEFVVIAVIVYLAVAIMIAGNERDRDLIPVAFLWPLAALFAFIKRG